jgi:hypothetical protein
MWAVLSGSLTRLTEFASAEEFHLGRSSHNPLECATLVPGRVYDGSTAERVDDFMRKVPEDSTIRLGNHVFETFGVWDNWLGVKTKGFRVKKGWTIIGKGTNTVTGTVFKLIDVPTDKTGLYEHNAVFSTGGIGLYSTNQPLDRRANVNQVTIRDVQIDCNYQAIAKARGDAIQLCGVQLLGNRGMRIENVLVRHAASKKVNRQGEQFEAFLVYIYNHWAPDPPGDYFYDRVAVTDYEGGYVSAIYANGNATGILQNCTVDLESDRSQRYGLNFAKGINRFTIRSNIIANATRGINNDTGPICTNVWILQNQFLRCGTGLLLANSYSNHIIGNTFSLSGNGSGIAIRRHPALQHVQSGACVVRENTFSAPGGEGITLCYQNEFDSRDVTLHWSSSNVIQNNVFLGELQNKIPPESIAFNIVRPGNRRHILNFPACDNGGYQGNLAAVGFPSEIGPGTPCSYCSAKAVESSYGFISRVKVHGTGIDMESDWGDGSGYSDFTTGYSLGVGTSRRQRAFLVQWADVRRGHVYEIDIEGSALGPRRRATFHVYIDLDHDGVFERKRELLASDSSRSSVRMTIPIPPDAALGSTRMRVIMAGGEAAGPCETGTFWGEVEDYTLSIMP